MNKKPNQQCPACERKGAAYIDCDECVYALSCRACGFRISGLSGEAAVVLWAWETLPRPKGTPRKARRKGK